MSGWSIPPLMTHQMADRWIRPCYLRKHGPDDQKADPWICPHHTTFRPGQALADRVGAPFRRLIAQQRPDK